jgi:hypothetical protein
MPFCVFATKSVRNEDPLGVFCSSPRVFGLAANHHTKSGHLCVRLYWIHTILTWIGARTMGPPEETQTEHETTTSRGSPDFEALKTILLGLLCAVLLFLLIFLVINTWPTLVSYYRKFVPDDRNHIEKRTQTIRAWTISKVRVKCLMTENTISSRL